MEREKPVVSDLQIKFGLKCDFVAKAIGEGAHLKVPFGVSEDAWVLQKNIVGVLLGSPATTADLGRQYGRSREDIRQLFNKGMRELWENSAKKLQKQFPLESLLGAKKPAPLHLRMERSRVNGGKSWNIFQDVQNRTITREDIEKKRLSNHVRKVLRGWGVDVGSKRFLSMEDLKAEFEGAKSYAERQAILDDLPFYFLRKYNKESNEIVVALRPFLWQMGIRVRNCEKALEVLRKAGIPVRVFGYLSTRGQQNYHFFLRGYGYEEKARSAAEKYRLTIA